MPPLPTISGVHRVSLEWRQGTSGPTAANVMHFHGASTDTNALYAALGSALSANCWLGIGSDCKIYQVAITPLDGSTATAIYNPTGAQWGGSGTPGDYIPSAAGVLSLRTLKRGRRYRGRVYVPFILEQVVSSGTFSASLSLAQTAWNTFLTSMAAASYPWHVATYGYSLHRTKNSGGGYTLTPVTWPPDSTPVQSVTYEQTLGTQRRRQSRLR